MNSSIIAKAQTFCNTGVNLSIASTEFQTWSALVIHGEAVEIFDQTNVRRKGQEGPLLSRERRTAAAALHKHDTLGLSASQPVFTRPSSMPRHELIYSSCAISSLVTQSYVLSAMKQPLDQGV
jgi:hypothetical protein